MNHKLSARAWEILLVIDERGQIGNTWVPGDLRGTSDWCDRLGYYVNINGSGDASILRSLWKKNLAEPRRSLGPYACKITEDGRLLVERSLEQGTIPLTLKD
jgi:hypothetical protein